MTSPFKLLFPTVYRSNMKVWIYILTFAVSSSSVLSQACPSEHFSATFLATIEQTADSPFITQDDPELTFFRNTMGFQGRRQDFINGGAK